MSHRGLRERRRVRWVLGALAALGLAGPAVPAFAEERAVDPADAPARPRYARYVEPDVQRARRAVAALQRADPGLQRLFDRSAAYAVFAEMRTGGGADGVGVLYEEGQAAGRATLPLPPPGQRPSGVPYTEVIFFESQQALAAFKRSGPGVAARARPVAVVAGAAAGARWVDGVAIFTLGKVEGPPGGGPGAQPFEYLPYHREIVTGSR